MSDERSLATKSTEDSKGGWNGDGFAANRGRAGLGGRKETQAGAKVGTLDLEI